LPSSSKSKTDEPVRDELMSSVGTDHLTERAEAGWLVYEKIVYESPTAEAMSGDPSPSKSEIVGGPPPPAPGMSSEASIAPVAASCTRTVPAEITTSSGLPSPSRSAIAGYPSACGAFQSCLPSMSTATLPPTMSWTPSPLMSAKMLLAPEIPLLPRSSRPAPARSEPSALNTAPPTTISGCPSPSMLATLTAESTWR